MKFQITDIEFDLTDDCGEYIDTEMLQDQLQKSYIKTLFNVMILIGWKLLLNC